MLSSKFIVGNMLIKLQSQRSLCKIPLSHSQKGRAESPISAILFLKGWTLIETQSFPLKKNNLNIACIIWFTRKST